MTDKEIVDLYWQRSQQAISETQTKYESYLSKIAYNVLSDYDDSAEAVNDTYLAAWNSMPDNRPDSLSAYLGKIARRIAIDAFRKTNAQKRVKSEYSLSYDEMDDICPDSKSVEDEVITGELDRLIDEFLRGERYEARVAFLGRYYRFDSIETIADYTGMSVGSVKTMLSRVRAKLKNYLESAGYSL